MKRIHLFHAIGEAVIPLMGLLFFDWGLYFILLFYFIDLLTEEVFVYIKVNKIIEFQKINYPKKLKFGRLFLNTLFLFALMFLVHIAIYFIVPGINFYTQFVAFLNYEEAGIPIPQAYILLPLVVLGSYQQYKMTFIQTQKYKIASWKQLILNRRKALYLAIIGTILSILIAYFIALPEFIYVLAIVGVKFYVDIKREKI